MTISNSQPAEDKETTYRIDGKGFRARFIFLDLLAVAAIMFLVNFVMGLMVDSGQAVNGMAYVGILVTVSFCFYMGTARISLRRLAFLSQIFTVLDQYVEGPESDITSMVMDLRNGVKRVIENPKNGKGEVELSYVVNENGIEELIARQ